MGTEETTFIFISLLAIGGVLLLLYLHDGAVESVKKVRKENSVLERYEDEDVFCYYRKAGAGLACFLKERE